MLHARQLPLAVLRLELHVLLYQSSATQGTDSSSRDLARELMLTEVPHHYQPERCVNARQAQQELHHAGHQCSELPGTASHLQGLRVSSGRDLPRPGAVLLWPHIRAEGIHQLPAGVSNMN